MQYNQQPKQIITLPKNQTLISNPNVQAAPGSNPQIIVLKNQNFTTDQPQQQSQQQQQQQAISSQRIVTPGQTSSTSVPQPVGFLGQMKPAAQQNPTILKLVSTKINKMPQILNISSQPFNSNLLKTSMRPVTSAPMTSQPNSASFIIKNNNPTQMITSNNKPNQIVHLSKINTSKCFLSVVISLRHTEMNQFSVVFVVVNEIMSQQQQTKIKSEASSPAPSPAPQQAVTVSKSIAELLNTQSTSGDASKSNDESSVNADKSKFFYLTN